MFRKEKKEKDLEGRVGAKKFWAWHSREISDTAIIMLLGYLQFFCTDVIGISPLIVGTLLAASKIIDGVTDILAGYIVDRTNTKMGRGRPYDFCLFGTWITLILLFSCPANLSNTGKVAWVVVFYVLSNAVFTTLLNAGETVFRLRAFNEKQIIRMSSYGGIFMCFSGIFCGMLVPVLVKGAGTDVSGWTRMAAMIGIPLALLGFCRFLFVKERDDLVYTRKEQEKLELSQIFKMLGSNRYLWIILLVTLLGSIVGSLGVSVYYFQWILGDLSIQSLFAGVSAIAIVGLAFLPKLLDKFGVQKTLIAGAALSTAAALVSFLFYDNIPVLLICYIFSSMGNLPDTYLVSVLLLDNANYNEYKGLHRMEGSMGSVQGFMKRACSALGSLFLGIALTLMHYDSNMTELLPETFWGLRILMYGVPVITGLLTVILWKLYTLEKKMPKIKAELEERRRQEA